MSAICIRFYPIIAGLLLLACGACSSIDHDFAMYQELLDSVNQIQDPEQRQIAEAQAWAAINAHNNRAQARDAAYTSSIADSFAQMGSSVINRPTAAYQIQEANSVHIYHHRSGQ